VGELPESWMPVAQTAVVYPEAYWYVMHYCDGKAAVPLEKLEPDALAL